MMYQVKGTTNSTLLMGFLVLREEKEFYSFMIRFQSSSELMLLDCELHKFLFFFFFSIPLGWTEWLEWTGVGYFPSFSIL